MKLYGFSDENSSATELNQVTLEVDFLTLRKLSKFFSVCAKEMEEDKDWDHEHFRDFLEEELDVDLVIYRKR